MSFDYLSKYHMNDIEKEEALMMSLKRVRSIDRRWMPKPLKKLLNFHTWKILESKYDQDAVGSIMEQLHNLQLIKASDADRTYHITQRGKDAIKRGWVYKDCSWYMNGKAAKYAVYISLAALFLTLFQLIFKR